MGRDARLVLPAQDRLCVPWRVGQHKARWHVEGRIDLDPGGGTRDGGHGRRDLPLTRVSGHAAVGPAEP